MIALKIDNRLFFLQFLHALHGKIFFGEGIDYLGVTLVTSKSNLPDSDGTNFMLAP